MAEHLSGEDVAAKAPAANGHRQALMTNEDLQKPHERLGTWMLLGDHPWPDDVPDGCVPRAVYEPDEAPAPATRWVYRRLIYT